MPTPKKSGEPSGAKRPVQVNLRYTQGEYDKVTKAAQTRGLSIGVFIRMLSLTSADSILKPDENPPV